MAELQMHPKRGGRIAAPRIDLTPMVDLGFLLITFFMMSTTMAKPKAMDIQMPYQPPGTEPTAWKASTSVTLLPAKDHRVFYYEGVYEPTTILKEAASITDLRKILQEKQAQLRKGVAGERDLQVLIKPHATAMVDDVVSLFDEMSILQVRYFAMVNIYPGEEALVNNKLW